MVPTGRWSRGPRFPLAPGAPRGRAGAATGRGVAPRTQASVGGGPEGGGLALAALGLGSGSPPPTPVEEPGRVAVMPHGGRSSLNPEALPGRPPALPSLFILEHLVAPGETAPSLALGRPRLPPHLLFWKTHPVEPYSELWPPHKAHCWNPRRPSLLLTAGRFSDVCPGPVCSPFRPSTGVWLARPSLSTGVQGSRSACTPGTAGHVRTHTHTHHPHGRPT